MRSRTALLSLALVCLCALSAAGPAERWWSHIKFLADDKLEGRDTGSEGYRKAAAYVAAEFERSGLEAGGVNGYLQPVTFTSRRIVEEQSSLALVRAGVVEPVVLGDEATFNMRVSPAAKIEAPIVFVGYGLTVPELKYDDLAGLDLKGKVALLLTGGPSTIPGPLLAHYQSVRWSILKATGALGVLSISNPKGMDVPWERSMLARFMPALTLADSTLDETAGQQIAVTVNPARAEKFFTGSGHTFKDLLALSNDGKPLPRFPIPASVRAAVTVTTAAVESSNVAGILRGTDPRLKDEYVVVSAHLDHVGVGKPINGDSIFNGAMDNASGVATLLETAAAIKDGQKTFKRSVVFLAVTAEEKGLLGSRYYAAHPTVPGGAIVANLNTDMFLPLFPMKSVIVQGLEESDLADDLRSVASPLQIKVLSDPEPERNAFIRSDQYSFIRRGVPALSLKVGFDKGSPEHELVKRWRTERYHAPSDDLNQPLDLQAAADFNRLYLRLVEAIANRATRPRWNADSFFRRFATATQPSAAAEVPTQAPEKPAPPPQPQASAAPTRANILRGEYGRYRANNDLLFYHLDVRVDPEKKVFSGKNTIRFRMLADDTRIQLDLFAHLNVEKILFGATPLKYERELNAVFVDFPETLKTSRVYTIDFYYSGSPPETGRPGGIAFRKDASGHHWINTTCEGPGASIWWPNKDQWRDEVESMQISVAIPSDLVDVSNGKFLGKVDLDDGYTRWDWLVQYPINSYNVSLNIGNYVHFADRLGDLPLDFYVTRENLEKARRQFAQARSMLEAYEKYFGEYPFKKDGYKLIEVPYSGMEHQSAVTYGNRFANGYLERDWTGVGVSTKFDFIIIHESGHEWFGNAVSAADVSDMWIHEGWTTYLECLYVEHMFGYDDAVKYVNGYKSKVRNQEPIVTPRGIHRSPPQDMYFKGALFLHTLRSVVNDDRRWWKLLHDLYQHFKYKNILTEDIVRFFNEKTGKDLTPLFDQYLRRTAIPTLELTFREAEGTVAYRWKADVPGFAMPVRVGKKGIWQIIEPTMDWKTMRTAIARDEFEVATDLYYVNVNKQ